MSELLCTRPTRKFTHYSNCHADFWVHCNRFAIFLLQIQIACRVKERPVCQKTSAAATSLGVSASALDRLFSHLAFTGMILCPESFPISHVPSLLLKIVHQWVLAWKVAALMGGKDGNCAKVCIKLSNNKAGQGLPLAQRSHLSSSHQEVSSCMSSPT